MCDFPLTKQREISDFGTPNSLRLFLTRTPTTHTFGKLLPKMEFVQHVALAAINAVLSDSSTKIERDSAQKYLHDLKEQEVCMSMMLQILATDSADHNDWNRQLALSILDDWLKGWWNRIPEDAQMFIRSQCVTLLTSSAVGASKGLRTKLAVILCNVACRQYPQQWPSFLDDVVGLWVSTGLPAQREICIMTLEFLVQDCVDGDFNSTLPTLRRQEIVSGLRERLLPLLQTLHAFLTQCALQLQGGIAEQVHEGKVLGTATLRLAVALAAFAKSGELCAPGHDLSRLTLQLLSVPVLQADAVNLFHALTSLKFEPQLFAGVLEMVADIPVTVLPDHLGESIAFQRVYAEGVYQLLGNNIATAMDDKFWRRTEMGAVLGKYMSLMSRLLDQPSRRLAADVLGSWIRIFKEKAILQLPWAGQVMALVLRVYHKKTMRVLWDPVTESPESEEDQEDFDDIAEYTEFRNGFNCQLRLLADVAGKRFPAVSAQFLLEETQALVAAAAARTETGAMPAGLEAADLEIVRKWDSLLVMWGNIFREADMGGTDASEAAVRQMLTAALEVVLQWEPPASLGPLADTFSCLRVKAATDAAPLLELSPQHLNYTVQILFTSYGAGERPGANPPPGLIKKNRAVSAAIAQLCDACVVQIIRQEEVVTAVVQQLVTWLGSADVNRDDQCSFREALVAISDKVPDAEGRTNILNAALGSAVEGLRNICDSAFASPLVLLQKCYGERSVGGQVPTLDAVWHTLGSLLSASKRVAHPLLPLTVWTHAQTVGLSDLGRVFPFVTMWQSVLPSLLMISKTIHGVWEPSFRAALTAQEPQLAELYMPAADAVRLKAWEATDREEAAPKPAAAPRPIEVLRAELSQCRQQMYHLLGQSCLHKAFYASSQRQTLLKELAGSAKSMENVHLTYLMARFVEPFVLNAPPCYFGDVSDFLTSFLPDALLRLGVAWQEVPTPVASFEQTVYCFCSLPQNGNYCGIGPEGMEVYRTAMVTEMTRGYSELLASLGLCRGYLAIAVPASSGTANPDTSSSAVGGSGNSGKGKGGALQAKQEKKKKFTKVTPVALFEPEKDTDESRLAQKMARRAALQGLLMGEQSTAITRPYMQSIVALLCLPDSSACRVGVQLARNVLVMAQSDTRLVPAVGKDCFAAALSVLLKQERWSTGLEWDLIDFLQETYCTFVLGLELDPGKMESDVTKTARRTQHEKQADMQLPLQILGAAGAEPAAADALKAQLAGCTNKKKRREYFKDYLAPLIERHAAGQAGGGDRASGASTDSVFAKKLPAVLNIRTRLASAGNGKSKKAMGVLEGSENFSLANLFDDNL